MALPLKVVVVLGIGHVNSHNSADMPSVSSPTSPRLNVIILAGGRSTRMGSDKSQVRVAGHRLIDILLAELPLTSTPIVVSPYELQVDCLRVCEQPPFQGPVAGIAAAVPHCANTDFISIVAVDAPHSPRLIPHQLSALTAHPQATACAVVANNFTHPVGVLWRANALQRAIDGLCGNFDVPLKSLLPQNQLITITGDGSERDYDTIAELERLGTVSFG